MNEHFGRNWLERNNFQGSLNEMREKGIVEELTLSGYVCNRCSVVDPIGYKVIGDVVEEEERFTLGKFFSLNPFSNPGRINYILKDDLACAICFDKPVDVTTTYGQAVLKRIEQSKLGSTGEDG